MQAPPLRRSKAAVSGVEVVQGLLETVRVGTLGFREGLEPERGPAPPVPPETVTLPIRQDPRRP